MNRLHEKGWIGNPRSKSKSVLVTEKGQARELFEKPFSQAEENSGRQALFATILRMDHYCLQHCNFLPLWP
jgi:hypothetical protein